MNSISTAGTVDVASTNVVTGTNTQFVTDGVQADDYLVINSVPYKIASVASETSLTLDEWIEGGSVSGESTDIGRYVSNISIQNLTVTQAPGAQDPGIYIAYCINPTIERNILSYCGYGIRIGNNFNLQCNNNISILLYMCINCFR